VRLLLVALAVALVPAVAVVISKAIARWIRAGVADARRLHQTYRRLRRLHVLLWLATVVAVAYGLECPRIVRFNWHLDRVPLLDDLLIFVPVLLPLVLSWAAFYEVDRAGSVRAPAPGTTDEKMPTVAFASRREYVDVHVRHYLAIVLLPVVGLLAAQDFVGLLGPSLLGAEAMPLALAGMMVLFLAVFPILLRRVWRTRPLAAGTLRTRLEAMARHSGLALREILVWETGSMVANAAVAGFMPRPCSSR